MLSRYKDTRNALSFGLFSLLKKSHPGFPVAEAINEKNSNERSLLF